MLWRCTYPFLVNQAKQGRKCEKRFKRPALTVIVAHVNEEFDTFYTTNGVVNHCRIIKALFAEMKRCHTIWNVDKKTITLGDQDTYVQHGHLRAYANPKLSLLFISINCRYISQVSLM